MTDRSVDAVLGALTTTEKLRLVRGHADPEGGATGYLPGVDRLDLPPLRFVDGPLGVRDGEATAFPATVALGATFDPDLARRLGTALAAETRAKGHDVLLAPGLNLIRVPTGGRTFEYLSEDPRLSSRVGAGYVRGLAAGGVGATAKHFVANNQEHDRDRVDVVVDERALRELYLPSFRAAVEAGAGAVMAAYNRVNARHMSEHGELLRGVLRDEWGFEGVVVSDWWGTHDAVSAAEGGLDVEMPGVSPLELVAGRHPLLRAVAELDLSGRLGIDPPLYWRPVDRLVAADGQPDPYPQSYFRRDLRQALVSGAVGTGTIDGMVSHVLGLYDHLGLLDGERADPDPVDHEAHHTLSREVATRGTVLLETGGLLPLSGGESLAVVGPNADRAKVGGGGSSEVTPTLAVSPVGGLRERATDVRFERGVARIPEPSLFDLPGQRRLQRLRSGGDLDAAVEAAEAADVAVVVVQDGATEGEDRGSMGLPGGQDRLVRAVAEANPRTVVVCRTSGPVEMPWLDEVGAVVQTWYPGQADGEALAAVLFGEDPGGRLPVTVGREFGDYPVATERRYPGVDGHVHYDEGVFVGYRHFDREGIDPLFPFGHGCSYAAFEYRDLAVEWADDDGSEADEGDLAVAVTVENASERPGREVVQAYVDPPAGPVPRPPKVLGGFATLSLAGGDRDRVRLSVPRRTLARYDPTDGWTVDPGTCGIAVGRSSRDLRVRTTIPLESGSTG